MNLQIGCIIEERKQRLSPMRALVSETVGLGRESNRGSGLRSESWPTDSCDSDPSLAAGPAIPQPAGRLRAPFRRPGG